jgi:hypothetical protein
MRTCRTPFLALALLIAPSLALADSTLVEPGEDADALHSRIVHIPAPEVPTPPSRIHVIQEDFLQGRSRHTTGRFLAWGGVATGLAGLASDRPTFVALGWIGYEVGVPLIGSGVGKMIRSRSLLDSSWQLRQPSGWTAYHIGTTLEGAGVALHLFSIPLYIVSKYEGNAEIESMLTTGRTLFVAGAVLHGLAWAQFAGDATDIEESDRTVPFSIRVLPVGVGSKGDLQPGALLSLRF